MFTLHEAVNAAAIAAKEETEKFHHIIAHLQKELVVTNQKTEEFQVPLPVPSSLTLACTRSLVVIPHPHPFSQTGVARVKQTSLP